MLAWYKALCRLCSIVEVCEVDTLNCTEYSVRTGVDIAYLGSGDN